MASAFSYCVSALALARMVVTRFCTGCATAGAVGNCNHGFIAGLIALAASSCAFVGLGWEKVT